MDGNPLSIKVTERVFEILILLFAVWTLLFQFSIIKGLSFLTLSIIFSITLPFIFMYLAFFRNKSPRVKYIPDYSTIIFILILVVIGAALALFSIRPDPDDSHYASRPVFYLENLSFSLDYLFRNHVITGFDPKVFYAPILITQTIEFLWAYLALLSGRHFLDIYYYLVPVLGGALIPPVWYLLFSRFTKNHIVAALGAAVVVGFLCTAGQTHQSFGNFSFVRIWQGKVLLMSILLPLFAVYSMDFFESPNRRNWSKLFLLSIASTGFSSTALFLFPPLAISMATGYLVSRMRGLPDFKVLLVYFTSLFYIFVIGLYCLQWGKLAGSYFFPGTQTTLLGIFGLVFGGFLSYAGLVFILSTILSLWLLEGSSRIFLAGWLASVFVFFLNPLPAVSNLVVKHLTSTSTYWRLIYILPFPLTVGIPVVALLKNRLNSVKFAYIFLSIIIVSVISINLFPDKFAVFNKISFGLRYKLIKQDELDVRRMLDKLPDGPMIAPIRYSSIITTFTSRLPQIVVREAELMHFSSIHARREIAEKRVRAVYFISGSSWYGFESFAALLKTDLRTVVLDSRISYSAVVQKTLYENNFVPVDKGDYYIAYVRRSSTGNIIRPVPHASETLEGDKRII